jgi:hypothetical protein
MQTDYDKFASLVRELAIPAFFNTPLSGPMSITIGNDLQGQKVRFNFDKDAKYTGVTFI